uniref:Uncharacterized protein n=1 Tax=Mus musculus TaxID=10090 RepID=Q6R5D0_MOUSE|nr:unknown [Mus musculus]
MWQQFPVATGLSTGSTWSALVPSLLHVLIYHHAGSRFPYCQEVILWIPESIKTGKQKINQRVCFSFSTYFVNMKSL